MEFFDSFMQVQEIFLILLLGEFCFVSGKHGVFPRGWAERVG